VIGARSAIGPLFERALAGERRALGKLITVAERGERVAVELGELAHRASGRAHVVGMTGAPGAGKSTLTGRLLARLAAAGRRPAVLAVDPSSPVTGGAILGDRIRMDGLAAGAFVRSMATRGHQGGLSVAVPDAVRLLDAAGFDPVIVETTGVGQAEVDIVGAADTTVLILAPGWGDAVQANKAGLLEVADLLVVNKADRPGAADTRRDLELMLDLGHVSGHEERVGQRPSITLTVATSGEGVPQLASEIDRHRELLLRDGALECSRRERLRREVLERTKAILVERCANALGGTDGAAALAEVHDRRISPSDAARRLASTILRPGPAHRPR